jgi:predicted metalloprotease with PDZ domain
LATWACAYLTNQRAFFNGSSVFLQPVGFENNICEVQINYPTDEVLGDWACATLCDNCTEPDTERQDITELAQKFLSTIYRTEQLFSNTSLGNPSRPALPIS